MTERNCFGYVYYRANIMTPERFVLPKTSTELLQDFIGVDSFAVASVIAFIDLLSSQHRPDRHRFVAKHTVWIEEDHRTISHRPDSGLQVAHFNASQLESIYPDYYDSSRYRVLYLARS